VDAKAELPPARGMNARSGERMCEFAQRERICLAEVVHARPFVLAAGTLRARIPKNRYPQLDRIAVADGLRLSPVGTGRGSANLGHFRARARSSTLTHGLRF
jgi:hypothetical protein